jgi:hypothetical protein
MLLANLGNRALPPMVHFTDHLPCFQLVIPKYHGAKLADIPDDHLSEVLVSLAASYGLTLSDVFDMSSVNSLSSRKL